MFGILYTFNNKEDAFNKFKFSLESLLENTDCLDDIEIIVLIPKDNQHIKDILNIYDKVKIIYNEDVEIYIRKIYNNLKFLGRWGTQALFKFYLFIKDFYSRFNKCVYLDIDTVIMQDIHLLFNEQFTNNSLIMLRPHFTDYNKFVMSKPTKKRNKEYISHHQFLNSPTSIKENFKNRQFIYGNSGVIYLNSKNADNINIFDELIELSKINNEVQYPDQDLLNIFLSIEKNNILFQPLKNRFNNSGKFKEDDVIRHFTHNRKMTNTRDLEVKETKNNYTSNIVSQGNNIYNDLFKKIDCNQKKENKYSIDVVITYVDKRDNIWLQTIKKYNAEITDSRFRSWDNLQYLFRGIDRYMKFVRNVYLVVSNIEQVPNWIDQNKVKIILHKDIIPEKYLPTFNSTTIEMYLCFIPGISENFIYFNDDMFPNSEMTEYDFFINDKPKYQIVWRNKTKNYFRMQCKNSYDLASRISNYKNITNFNYFSPIHSVTPMRKDICLELWNRVKKQIEYTITKFREPFNLTQYLFPDYSIMTGRYYYDVFDSKYFDANELDEIKDSIIKSKYKIICINDAKTIDFNFSKREINEIFKYKFFDKCIFEK